MIFRKKKKFDINKVTNLDIALTMDEINNQSISYYCLQKENPPCPYDINNKLYKINNRITSHTVQLTIDLMINEKYIETVLSEDNESIKSFRHTEKGLKIFFEGGFAKQVKKKNLERCLMITGQISIILAGLYYFVELVKIFFPSL